MPEELLQPATPAPAAVLLLPSAGNVSFGTCQVCLVSEAGQLIGDVPWCARCRELYHAERPYAVFD